jgi:hypothetical protein
MLAPRPGEGNLTNVMQVRRNVNIRNNCLVCGEVMSLINPLERVVIVRIYALRPYATYHVLQWVYQLITPPHKTVIPYIFR